MTIKRNERISRLIELHIKLNLFFQYFFTLNSFSLKEYFIFCVKTEEHYCKSVDFIAKILHYCN